MNNHTRIRIMPAARGSACAVVAAVALITLLARPGAAAPGKTAAVPESCYPCHKTLKTEMGQRHTHAPFQEGKCLSCHDVHASDHEKMMKDDVNPLCLECHEALNRRLKKETMHGALKTGTCGDCHASHASDNTKLLKKAEADLCRGCHQGLKNELKSPFLHAPFREGKCSLCHDPHSAKGDALLSREPNALCRQCHEARCSVGGVALGGALKNTDCTSCHSGHASSAKGLLGPYGHAVFLKKECTACHEPLAPNRKPALSRSGKKTCLSCHQRSKTSPDMKQCVELTSSKNSCVLCHNSHGSTNKRMIVRETKICMTCHEQTEKRTKSMERALKTIRCEPVKMRRCFACHVPMHSDKPLSLKADGIELCAKCHTATHKVSHPKGPGVIDPRTNLMVTCLSCHSMHGAQAEFMLAFDRKRQLCIQCHKK